MKEKYLEFELDGEQYRAGRLDAITQLGITMKLGDFLPSAGRLLNYIKTHGSLNVQEIDPELLGIIGRAMASLPDESREWVVNKCLSAVEKQHGPGWMPMMTRDAEGTFQLDYELDLRELVALLMRVFQHNLWSFIPALGLNSTAQA